MPSPPFSAFLKDDSFLEIAYNTLSSNPYFSAGAGLYGLGVITVLGRTSLRILTTVLKRRFMVSMECTSRDASYEWMMQWLARHPSFRFQQMSVTSKGGEIAANDMVEHASTFVPCPNLPHYLLHRGHPIVLVRKRQIERAMGSDVLEILELTTIGKSGEIFKSVLREAQAEAIARNSNHTVIYHNGGGRWIRHTNPRQRRKLETVILDGTQREDLMRDIHQFIEARSYYDSCGVPYRRGYLLYGPPGCGKSSLVSAIAGDLRMAISLVSLGGRGLDDEALNSLLNSAEEKSILLLEDIDRAFTSDNRVTMSGLLNALDGVAAQEGRLLFMTTNHVERLDSALIRPGRVDIRLEIGLLSTKQILKMFIKFFPQSPADMAMSLASVIPPGTVSAAELQAHLFLFRHDPQAAICKARGFLKEHREFEKKIQEERKRENLNKQAQCMPSPPMLFK